MVKLALAVVAAVLLHVVASQPLGLEVEIKLKVSNGQEELDLGSSLTGQEKSEQPLSSGRALSNRGNRSPEIFCGSETQSNVVDLNETRRLFWTLKDAQGDCEVTFKVPPRQNFKIWLESFYLDGGDFKKGCEDGDYVQLEVSNQASPSSKLCGRGSKLYPWCWEDWCWPNQFTVQGSPDSDLVVKAKFHGKSRRSRFTIKFTYWGKQWPSSEVPTMYECPGCEETPLPGLLYKNVQKTE